MIAPLIVTRGIGGGEEATVAGHGLRVVAVPGDRSRRHRHHQPTREAQLLVVDGDGFAHQVRVRQILFRRPLVGLKADVREEVARTVIQHGWPLRDLRLERASLEEFFVQVTAEQAVAGGGAA